MMCAGSGALWGMCQWVLSWKHRLTLLFCKAMQLHCGDNTPLSSYC